MKTFYLLILIILSAKTGYSQSVDSMYNTIPKEQNCSVEVICTDSVYSFLKTAPLNQLGEGHLFALYMTPVPACELKENHVFLMFDKASTLAMPESEDLSQQEEMKVARERLADLYALAIDSATTFSQPVVTWDLTKFPKDWILYNQKSIYKIYNNIDAYTAWIENNYNAKHKSSKAEKQKQASLEGVRYAQSSSYKRTFAISLSVPVFDKSYQYALLFITNNSIGSEGASAFVLYKRDSAEGWKVYTSGTFNKENIGSY